ncbi:MAG TPA: GntR family transcriptional regulator [Casimicrobiaceae bacterium]|nr:GntR family transcriptional regulator [Casimicrobiaceae bacterium]
MGMHNPLMASDPLYKQVRSDLVNRLSASEWKPGEALPSERKLADHYGVGIATIRAAIGELTAMKVLARRQGKGTYVCREEERRSVYQFFHVVRDDGVKVLPVSELVWIKSGRADPDVAHALELPRTAGGLAIHRLRNVLTVNDVRIVVSDIAVSVAMFPGLTQQRVRTGGATIYAVYQSLYGINIVRTDEKLRASACDGDTARILRLRAGEPVLEVHRTAYTFNDVPVEVRVSRVRTRDYHYALSRGGAL